jgi:TetR/AcrR family transcriptional repressor of nem operon
MPRNKSFDPDEIMEKAMTLFWKKGYTNTSLSDLEKVTKLNRVSLYNMFKSKEHLFEACIDKYIQFTKKDFDEQIDNKGIQGLITYFERFQKKSSTIPPQVVNGCLMVNSCLECNALSNKTKKKIENHMQAMIEKYEAAIEFSKKKGEISSKIDVKAHAQFLITSMFGIVVQVRLAKDIFAASTAAGIVIETIKSWRNNTVKLRI